MTGHFKFGVGFAYILWVADEIGSKTVCFGEPLPQQFVYASVFAKIGVGAVHNKTLFLNKVKSKITR